MMPMPDVLYGLRQDPRPLDVLARDPMRSTRVFLGPSSEPDEDFDQDDIDCQAVMSTLDLLCSTKTCDLLSGSRSSASHAYRFS
jgi:hypothetical protein